VPSRRLQHCFNVIGWTVSEYLVSEHTPPTCPRCVNSRLNVFSSASGLLIRTFSRTVF
jgi:hypothetical protein